MLTNESRDEPGERDRQDRVTTPRDPASAPATVRSPPPEPAKAGERSGKMFVAGFIAVFAVVVAYFALGMPGMDHGNGSSMPGMDMGASSSPHRLVAPAEFEALLVDTSATLINVHVPYEGELVGTDLFMPFDAIDSTQLPGDKSAELLLYCRTGTMSATASAHLVDLGYTNVIELAGGMRAWEASNRTVVVSPQSNSG